MKKIIKIILIMLVIIFLLICILLMMLKYLASKPISSTYFNKIITSGVLENKYTGYVEYTFNSIEIDIN